MRGTLLIARLTWLETRRRRIALAALVCGLLFLAVFASAIYFGFRRAAVEEGVDAVGMRVAATVLTVAASIPAAKTPGVDPRGVDRIYDLAANPNAPVR